jgi:hypothetical protein
MAVYSNNHTKNTNSPSRQIEVVLLAGGAYTGCSNDDYFNMVVDAS